MWTRRRLIAGIGAGLGVAAVGLYAERARRWRAASAERARNPVRPAGVPVGPFDASSTAEEVTRGVDLSGQTMLVTGITSGIGLETMRVLALRGAHVIGTGRTLDRARAACASVSGRTTPLMLELTDYPSVVACAEAVRALDEPLDGLICNAGVMALQSHEQVDGVEKQFATNHLGHFLLVSHLIDRVKDAPQGRVVVVSSHALQWAAPAGIEWDNLSGSRDYDPDRAYGQSKLANALFSLELSRRLSGTGATSNALHPGVVDTKLFRHMPRSVSGFRGVFSPPKRTVEQGAATSCYVATVPVLAGVTGNFFADCNPIVPDPRALDREAAARLWTVSEQLLEPYLRGRT
jgi:NAD(P)-dependent dehydrogenase (short-subunit alcohol dehydrogenase family)